MLPSKLPPNPSTTPDDNPQWTPSPFTFATLAERALLALTDPDGEAEAVVQLDSMIAARVVSSYVFDHRSRPVAPGLPRRGFDNDRLLAALGVPPGRTSAIVRCPAHEDRHPSLSVRLDGDRILLHDFGGCDWPGILRAVQP